MVAPDIAVDGLSQLTTEELTRFLEISRGFAGSLDLDVLLRQVVESARDLLRADMSTLLLLDSDRAYLDVKASAGIASDVAKRLSTSVGQNLAGLVAKNGLALRTRDVALDPRSTLSGVCANVISSSILVPLVEGSTLQGVLAVETREAREFTDREELVLGLLANSACTAIETARLYRVQRDHVGRLELLIQRLNNQNDLMRRSREAHDTLMEAALLGVGQESLLQLLRERIPSPLVIIDQFGRRISMPNAEDPVGEQLWEACSSRPLLGRQLEHFRSRAGRRDPARLIKSGFWRLTPAMAAGELLGALVALEHVGLDEFHMLMLEDAGNILASELLRERCIALAEARADGDIVRTIFAFTGSAQGLSQRAALLGLDLRADHRVVVVRRAQPNTTVDLDLVSIASRRAATMANIGSHAGLVDGEMIVILSAGGRALERESIEAWISSTTQELATNADIRDLQFGISHVVGGDGDLRAALAQARQAVIFCAFGRSVPVRYFEDVKLASLMDLTDRDAIETYIKSAIGALEEYDLRKGSDLAATLETYLDHSCVALHAAQALFVHPHSLRYRLKRIAEIQSLDLEDPMARLTAHLALKLRGLSPQS